MIIDGSHDVFSENAEMLQNILLDFCRVKPPIKFYMMTSIKQSLGVYKILTQVGIGSKSSSPEKNNTQLNNDLPVGDL
jgi:hypothetical protein